MGLQRWWKLLFQINVSPILKRIRMVQAMFYSRLGHKPTLVLCQEGEARKAMKGWGEKKWGRSKWLAVFFHPAWVLRSSPPEAVHNNPFMKIKRPSYQPPKWPAVVIKDRATEGYFTQVKLSFQERNFEYSNPTEQSLLQTFHYPSFLHMDVH